MTGRGVLVQGALAVIGLGIAYVTWQREPERAAGEVVVVDTTKADLANVHFEDENSSVDIRRGREDGESAVWLRVEDKTPPAPRQPPVGPNRRNRRGLRHHRAAKKAPKPKPARELKGDEPAEKLLAEFAPSVRLVPSVCSTRRRRRNWVSTTPRRNW